MFIILPTSMDYRARRYPVVTFTIMGICVAIYLVTLILKLTGDADAVWQWEFEHLWLIPNESHWWTFITHMFVHQGFFHLLGNMIYFFLFGACVEDIIGRLHFIAFYLLSGIGAGLAYILLSPEHFASEIPMGGASGAISACIGGYLVLRAKAHIQFKWILIFFFRLFQGDFRLPAYVVISFWFLKDVALMALSAAVNKHGGGVAFGAHVGGTVLGAGLIALEKIRLKKFPMEEEEIEFVPQPVRPIAATTHVAAAREASPTRVYRLPSQSQPTAPAQPVAVAVETANILLHSSGVQSGPFTLSQIRQMLATGEIGPETFYWREGMADWRAAGELLESGAA